MVGARVDDRRAAAFDDQVDGVEPRTNVARIDRGDPEVVVNDGRHGARADGNAAILAALGPLPGSARTRVRMAFLLPTYPMDITDLRREYARESLDEHAVDRDPIAQFAEWFDEALKSELREPT